MSQNQEGMINWDRLNWIFIGIFVVLFSGFLYALVTDNAFYGEIFGGFSVALGTALLAFYTARLAGVTINEGRRERRQQRIKEQLEGLYSPLMAHIIDFERDKHYADFKDLLKEIKMRYEYLANPDFLKEMREYFVEYSIDFNRARTRGWENFIKPKIKLLKTDYEDLIKEYNSLTEPLSS